jgi:hypothetical protein
MHARLPGLVMVALLLAGCTAPASPPAATLAAPADEVVVDANRPDTSFTSVDAGPAAAEDETANLAHAPLLKRGEWWRIRTATPDGEQVEFVRVVANVLEDGYVMGMPHEGWFKEAVAWHSPAFGDVAFDLSYNTHNHRFAPVQFPLTDGATWDTEFATAHLTATAHVLDAATAEVTLTPQPPDAQPTDPIYALLFGGFGDATMKVTYDARQHEVVKFESAFIQYEVVEHGYDFRGWTTVPRGEETPIDHPSGPPMLRESLTIPVQGGFNRLTMMHFVGGVTPGAYRIRTVGPDGSEQVTESVGESGQTLAFYEATDPDGDWTLETTTAGAGFGYAMGIAYHQYDIHLPDGAKRADHSHKVIR